MILSKDEQMKAKAYPSTTILTRHQQRALQSCDINFIEHRIGHWLNYWMELLDWFINPTFCRGLLQF